MASSPALRPLGGRLHGWRARISRELAFSDRLPLSVLVLAAILITVFGVLAPNDVPYQVMILVMFVGSLWLGPRSLPWFVVFSLLCVCVMVAVLPSVSERSVVRILVTFAVGLLILVTSFRRLRLGVSAPRSESMFIDLRDRITQQGVIPQLPRDWLVESVTESAGGTAFAGDFVVAGMSEKAGLRYADFVVVDVSGKGVDAGTRALLLSGAFGGLLSALPAATFLPAASDFLLRQDWDEGFATAIHLHLCLDTGAFELRKAGHPPAIWLQAGSGGWRVLDSEGPLLGVVPDGRFDVVTGTLRSGDALMLYTDGLVETSRRDIGRGIDRLAGEGQRLVQEGFEGGAHRIVNHLGSPNDDRALVVVHRR